MSGLPWFKCYPQDLLNGMGGMPADERGIYISVLCLIYREGGPVRDEPREMAYNTGCTVKQWVKYRAALIVHGKLQIVQINGRDHLTNERCEEEIGAQRARAESLAERGSNGGKKRAENAAGKDNENNGHAQATASIGLKPIQQDKDTDTELEGSVAKATGGEPPNPDQKAWTEGPVILVAQGGMKHPAAKSYFGGLLSKHGLQPRDLLPAIAECEATGTKDPQGLMAGHALHRGRRRQQTGPPKRVGFV